MAPSQSAHNPRRRRTGDQSAPGTPATPDTNPIPENNPTSDPTTPHNGHPGARETPPMASHPATPTAPAPACAQPRRDQPTTGAGVSPGERAVMRARLAAMATPRPDDSPRLAKLRAVLRDQRLMAQVIANVERWPPLSEEQRDTLAALLGHAAARAARHTPRRAA